MFNIMIVGCKKTLVEYRGGLIVTATILEFLSEWGAYFLGMTLCSDSQGRSTSLSLHHSKNPTPKPFLKLPIPNPSPSSYTSPPQFPSKNSLSKSSPSKFSPNSPILTHTPPFLSPFIYTFSKNPLNSP